MTTRFDGRSRSRHQRTVHHIDWMAPGELVSLSAITGPAAFHVLASLRDYPPGRAGR